MDAKAVTTNLMALLALGGGAVLALGHRSEPAGFAESAPFAASPSASPAEHRPASMAMGEPNAVRLASNTAEIRRLPVEWPLQTQPAPPATLRPQTLRLPATNLPSMDGLTVAGSGTPASPNAISLPAVNRLPAPLPEYAKTAPDTEPNSASYDAPFHAPIDTPYDAPYASMAPSLQPARPEAAGHVWPATQPQPVAQFIVPSTAPPAGAAPVVPSDLVGPVRGMNDEISGPGTPGVGPMATETLPMLQGPDNAAPDQVMPDHFGLPVEEIVDERTPSVDNILLEEVSPGELLAFRPWWQNPVSTPMSESATTVTPDTLILSALRHSPQIAGLRALPEIRDAEVVEALADFDPTSFMEARFDDVNEPVGNLFTTGGPSRLLEHSLNVEGGARKRLQSGGSLEVRQRLGHENSNSAFILPNNQGTARLSLNYNQPLLNGAGKRVNRSQIVLAQISLNQAWDELASELQNHLLDVIEAYWNIYQQRSILLQRQRSEHRAEQILKTLAGRRGLDATETQIARVRAAVASRRLDVISAERDVRNVETDIRNLVQDPQLATVLLELVPGESPQRLQPEVNLHDSVVTAIQLRPEVNRKIRDIKSASVELDLARNDLLPMLNLVVSAYADGLAGSSDVPRAFSNSLSTGGPTYSTGLVFELPMGNRAAKARLRRQQAQIRLFAAQLQTTIGNVSSEVERATRDVVTNYERMRSSVLSVRAAELSLAAAVRQWELMSGDARSGSLLLDEVLDKQLLLVQEELTFARSEFEYMVALAKLRRAEGTLLRRHHIAPVCGGPDGGSVGLEINP
ncbi:MAG: TolC family protein [Planctomycetales bacterium]|nr:TolC family protein [Planctomycetales bacterium]